MKDDFSFRSQKITLVGFSQRGSHLLKLKIYKDIYLLYV